MAGTMSSATWFRRSTSAASALLSGTPNVRSGYAVRSAAARFTVASVASKARVFLKRAA